MTKLPEIRCSAWQDGGIIPIEYTAPREPNIQSHKGRQPENRLPEFSLINIPVATVAIALVVHDVLDGEPVSGERPGWTHYTAMLSPDGKIIKEGYSDEEQAGWVGPYPADHGEYHCTVYFLDSELDKENFTRACILEAFSVHGLGSANMVGKYTKPPSA
jgi:phosphatidylethanolamine-binding protein (PEBP) family uncharacterized protein